MPESCSGTTWPVISSNPASGPESVSVRWTNLSEGTLAAIIYWVYVLGSMAILVHAVHMFLAS